MKKQQTQNGKDWSAFCCEDFEGVEAAYANGPKTWKVFRTQKDLDSDPAVIRIASALGTSTTLAGLLMQRGYRDPESARHFLNCDEEVLHDPFLLNDMDAAVDRVLQAVENREKIFIYGDYDVDGVTSVTLLYLFLKSCGTDVHYYIPTRDKEGYGVSVAGIRSLYEQGARLILTVDTGTTAVEEVEYARTLGIDFVVTDHHECQEQLPRAVALVNPHRPDNRYPFTELAGVGVAFKFVCAYEMRRAGQDEAERHRRIKAVCKEYADLAAIGTIADVMPLLDENRLIVILGLSVLKATRHPGLSALIRHVRSGATEVDSSMISFGIAPRINAAGRMDSALRAVELLLAQDGETAERLASRLCEINTERQNEENRIAEEAFSRISRDLEEGREHVVVLADDNWKQGVIGIVASRITERYNVPCILISFQSSMGQTPKGEDVGKGSGRSVKGVNLVEALAYCSDLLVRYGGHELAAGLSVRRENIDAFRKKLDEYVGQCIGRSGIPVGTAEADLELEAETLSVGFCEELKRLEPCGVANPPPVFVLRNCRILSVTGIKNDKHSKLTVMADGKVFTALWFGMPLSGLPYRTGDTVDLLMKVSINDYKGVRTVQLMIQDMCCARDRVELNERQRQEFLRMMQGQQAPDAGPSFPERDDFARVYRQLRAMSSAGVHRLPVEQMLRQLNAAPGKEPVSYLKLRIICSVFYELHLCDSLFVGTEEFRFSLNASPEKAPLESSGVLRYFAGENPAL